MPPIGLEFIAPLLVNLSEEVNKINNALPDILDIKTEVTNTADTLRNLKVDFVNLDRKFSCAVKGMEMSRESKIWIVLI